jgi:hypothetical protein
LLPSEIDIKATIVTEYGQIPTIFDTLNDAYENYYNASEDLVADEIIVNFKGRDVT